MDDRKQINQEPNREEETGRRAAGLKTAIIVLSILLALSAGTLAVRAVYRAFLAPARTMVAVPDNLIGEEDSRGGDEPTMTKETLMTEETPGTAAPEEEDRSGSSAADNADTGHSAEDGSVSRGSGASGNTGIAGHDSDSSGQGENGGQLSASQGGSASGSHQAPLLELYKGKPGDNEKFETVNMFPGDRETKYFCVKAYHDADVTLVFRATVTEETRSLGDVLHIKVTHLETGQVIWDAPFSEIDGREFSEVFPANGRKETTAYYEITVSMDTSVGNEYQAARLKADFEWYVRDEEKDTDGGGSTGGGNQGGLVGPPPTGDDSAVALWGILAGSSVLLVLLLICVIRRRRKEDRQYE